jgi:hypothetical protein
MHHFVSQRKNALIDVIRRQDFSCMGLTLFHPIRKLLIHWFYRTSGLSGGR